MRADSKMHIPVNPVRAGRGGEEMGWCWEGLGKSQTPSGLQAFWTEVPWLLWRKEKSLVCILHFNLKRYLLAAAKSEQN